MWVIARAPDAEVHLGRQEPAAVPVVPCTSTSAGRGF